jgi:hypothetical protein
LAGARRADIRLVVEALGDADARLLLTSATPQLVDERVRDQVIAEARGNPHALDRAELRAPDPVAAARFAQAVRRARPRPAGGSQPPEPEDEREGGDSDRYERCAHAAESE